MYALYKKYQSGYHTRVDVLAYSNDKQELMELLPYEVERYIRSRCKRMLPYEMRHYLPNGYEPIEHWSMGPFGAEEFKVEEVEHARMRKAMTKAEIETMRRENQKYLVENLGLDTFSATRDWTE